MAPLPTTRDTVWASATHRRNATADALDRRRSFRIAGRLDKNASVLDRMAFSTSSPPSFTCVSVVPAGESSGGCRGGRLPTAAAAAVAGSGCFRFQSRERRRSHAAARVEADSEHGAVNLREGAATEVGYAGCIATSATFASAFVDDEADTSLLL